MQYALRSGPWKLLAGYGESAAHAQQGKPVYDLETEQCGSAVEKRPV